MSDIPRGAIRFNTDSNKPELWDGSQWAEFQLSTPNLGRSVDTQPGARGVLAGGYAHPTNTAKTSYINISSAGDSQDFGDLAKALRYQAGCSSSTRGITFAGYASPGNTYESAIYKTTIASTGSHASFGDVLIGGSAAGPLGHGSFSNQTRAFMFSGLNPSSGQLPTIKYVTIASEGNTVDFGDMTYNYRYGSATGSKTRAMPMGGYDGSGVSNVINVITMSTTGDAQDFGDLHETMSDGVGTTTNGTRSIVHTRSSGFTDVGLDSYSPISGGTTISFGNLSVARVYSPMNSCLSSPTRGVFPGGMTGPASVSGAIDYVEFATEGNAVDFGDMHTANSSGSYFSSAHGGL